MLFSAPRHQQRFQSVGSSEDLCLLNRKHWVNTLRAYYTAFSHQGALPNSLEFMHNRKPDILPLVSRILDVPVGERCCGRTQEFLVEPVDWAGGVAEHAVDA